ncbi:MAG TPA: lactate utilization protein [Blastocatellia bacterium]|nr:lactate utilization protein [Blastocatellia bacterium]
MTARDHILAKVKQALGRREVAQAVRLPRDRDVEPSPLPTDALVEQFAAALARVGGRFSVAADAQAVCEQIADLAAQVKARKAVGWHSPWLEQLGLKNWLGEIGVELITDRERPDKASFVNEAAEAALGITAVDFALADSGTLCLLAARHQPRTASLLPPLHVAVLRRAQIIRGLDELFARLPAGDELSSAVTLITGPSRTADIELTLVVGVHGPQQLHVILTD